MFVSGGMAEVGGCGLAAPNQAPLMRAKGGAERTKEMAGKVFRYFKLEHVRLVPSPFNSCQCCGLHIDTP